MHSTVRQTTHILNTVRIFIVINKQHNKKHLCGLGADALDIFTNFAPSFNMGGLVAVPVADVVGATNFFLDNLTLSSDKDLYEKTFENTLYRKT